MKAISIPLAAMLFALGCGAQSGDEGSGGDVGAVEDQVPAKPMPGDDAMVLVPGGEYTIGSDERPEKQQDKVQYFEPAHRVTIDAFYIDMYEVTFEQFLRFSIAADNDYKIQGSWRKYYATGKELFPVANILYEDAKAYCEWAGKRLPSEVEWEAAARGPEALLYPWGDEFNPSNTNVDESGGDTVEVGTFEADKSPAGAYDMFGNVQEWTESKFKPYPGNPNRRDSNYAKNFRVVRGASYAIKGSSFPLYARSAWYDNMQSGFGFRCAKNVEEEADTSSEGPGG